jgi:hypothetical protein
MIRFVLTKKATYLASKEGFKNYCEGCVELAGFENTESNPFCKRVFCSSEKCVKPAHVKEV